MYNECSNLSDCTCCTFIEDIFFYLETPEEKQDSRKRKLAIGRSFLSSTSSLYQGQPGSSKKPETLTKPRSKTLKARSKKVVVKSAASATANATFELENCAIVDATEANSTETCSDVIVDEENTVRTRKVLEKTDQDSSNAAVKVAAAEQLPPETCMPLTSRGKSLLDASLKQQPTKARDSSSKKLSTKKLVSASKGPENKGLESAEVSFKWEKEVRKKRKTFSNFGTEKSSEKLEVAAVTGKEKKNDSDIGNTCDDDVSIICDEPEVAGDVPSCGFKRKLTFKMAPTFDYVTIVGDNKDSNKMAAVDEEDSALLEIMSELSGTLNATATNQPQVPKTKWQRKRKRTASCDVTLDESILQQIECNDADKGKQTIFFFNFLCWN